MKRFCLGFFAAAFCCAAGCAGVPETPKPSVCVGSAGWFGPLEDILGNPRDLGELLQDRVEVREKEGRPEKVVDSLRYLLLTVTNTECEYGRKFVKELSDVTGELGDLKCRAALVLVEKEGTGAMHWREFEGAGVPIYVDSARDCYGFYVKNVTPSISVMDRWGTVVFWCEGYVAPSVLAKKIRDGDFAEVETAGG
ncbi:MAG: hypothetical protein ACYTAF_09455 [Planctomycetota bacterium]